jgi:hypothetical protein
LNRIGKWKRNAAPRPRPLRGGQEAQGLRRVLRLKDPDFRGSRTGPEGFSGLGSDREEAILGDIHAPADPRGDEIEEDRDAEEKKRGAEDSPAQPGAPAGKEALHRVFRPEQIDEKQDRTRHRQPQSGSVRPDHGHPNHDRGRKKGDTGVTEHVGAGLHGFHRRADTLWVAP